MRLTNSNVESLKFTGKKTKSGSFSACYYWDDLDGFGVRVYPSGKKSFVVVYNNKFGKQRWKTLGAFPQLSASLARKKAEEIRVQVRDGIDPRLAAEEARALPDVVALFELYVEEYAKLKKLSWKSDHGRVVRHVAHRWSGLSVGELSKKKVQKAFWEINDGKNTIKRPKFPSRPNHKDGGPVEANSFLQLVSGVFEWALREDYLPFGVTNPTKGIERYRTQVRTRWIRKSEMKWLLRAIDAHDNILHRTIFLLSIYTACRPKEARTVRWSDVDLINNLITFRKTKNGLDHTVPLCKPAYELLAELPRINSYVFPGSKEKSPYTNLSRVWTKIRKNAEVLAREAGTETSVLDVKLHDLRRTTATWLAISGQSELLIARLLNHRPQSITGVVYAHLDDSSIRAALEAHAVQLEEVKNY